MPTFNPCVSPVPRPLWNENLRHRLSKSAWAKLRRRLIEERGLRCETCGADVAEAKKLSAHEEWDYDTTTTPAVAGLRGIKLSCWLCHAVEHVGFANELARSGKFPNALEYAIAHFCKLNGVDRDVYEKHKDEAFAEWHRRNALGWRVDWGAYSSLVSG